MLEILTLSYFSKKIREIADNKNVNPSKWLKRLFITWFGIEIIIIIIIIIIIKFKN